MEDAQWFCLNDWLNFQKILWERGMNAMKGMEALIKVDLDGGGTNFKIVDNKEKRSKCWECFGFVVEGITKEKTIYVACKYCHDVYVFDQNNGTTLLNNHMKRCGLFIQSSSNAKNEIEEDLKEIPRHEKARKYKLVEKAKGRAKCWTYFQLVLEISSGKETGYIACKHCYSVYTSNNPTSTLNKHLTKCQATLEVDNNNNSNKDFTSINNLSPQKKDKQLASKRKAYKISKESTSEEDHQEQLAKRRRVRASQDPADKAEQNGKRNKEYQEEQAALQQAVDKQVKELADVILDMVDIGKDTIDFMAENQNFTKHPNLGLVYYHLCGPDPDMFVFNDETLIGEEGKKTCERLLKGLGDPIGQAEAIQIQQSIEAHDTSKGKIAACASCNEILYECHKNIVETKLEDLHQNFLLTDVQVQEIGNLPADLVRDFVSVYQHEGKLYHLNPDLIPDPNVIVLCKVCSEDPFSYRYSLASGCDFGRLKRFPIMNQTTLSVVCPIRNFNIDLMIKPNHSTGHSICFPSNGPNEASKVLPSMDSSRLPQVTFLGPKERWRVIRKKWKKLYHIDCNKAYEALRVWTGLDNPNFKGIEICKQTKEATSKLHELFQEIEEQMIFSQDETITDRQDKYPIHEKATS
jgi:hypothetical protein